MRVLFTVDFNKKLKYNLTITRTKNIVKSFFMKLKVNKIN